MKNKKWKIGGIYTYLNECYIPLEYENDYVFSYNVSYNTKSISREQIVEILKEQVVSQSRFFCGKIFAYEQLFDGYLGQIDEKILDKLLNGLYNSTTYQINKKLR